MVILRTRNKITDFLMILAWASAFNRLCNYTFQLQEVVSRRRDSQLQGSEIVDRMVDEQPKISKLMISGLIVSL